MKRLRVYAMVFVAGAVTSQMVVSFLLGTIDVDSGTRSFGVSDEYVNSRFSALCEHLESLDCSCEPVVFTEAMCEADLSEFLRQRSLVPE